MRSAADIAARLKVTQQYLTEMCRADRVRPRPQRVGKAWIMHDKSRITPFKKTK